MTQDQETYRRATVTAAIGAVTQLVLAVGMALTGLWAQSPPMYAATWHFFGGLPIWVILALLYYQHQLERIEALEAEELARQDERAASLFQRGGEDVHVARQRLRRLYRWGVGVVSVLVAVYLLGAGTSLFLAARARWETGALREAAIGGAATPLALMGVLAAIAFVAFIVARYVSGMTGLAAWRLLRGGASYLMGCALMAVLLLLGAFAAQFGEPAVLGVLSLLIPALMGLVGLEVGVNFVLDAYRPRRPDEVPRPAFDSRALGLLTRPESLAKAIRDTLNYQFGFEISRSWFYRLLSGAITPLTALGALVLWLMSSIVLVEPHEEALVLLAGEMTPYQVRDAENGGPRYEHPPGVHFKAPWPLGTAESFPVQRLQQVTVGAELEYERGKPVLWTNPHHGEPPEYLLTAPTADPGDEGVADRLGFDQGAPSLVTAQVNVQYRIKRLAQYASVTKDPDGTLRALAQREVTRYFVQKDIDTLLATGRSAAGKALKSRVQAAADRRRLGIEVVFVGIPGIHPPGQSSSGRGDRGGGPAVAKAFLEQIAARSEQRATVEAARRDAIEMLAGVAGSRSAARELEDEIAELRDLKAGKARAREVAKQELALERRLAEAGGSAAELIYDARAYRWRRALGEEAKAQRFARRLRAYEAAPGYYSAKRALEVLAAGMVDRRKMVITADSEEPPIYRLDLTTPEDALAPIFQDSP